VSEASSLEDALLALEKAVTAVLQKGGIPFVLGGSNDQSYANASALMNVNGGGPKIGVVNIDAHLDVRPLKNGQVHSGSPFRLLLEDKRFSGTTSKGKFIEFASQGNQCSIEHVRYLQQKQCKIYWLNTLRCSTVDEHFKSVLNDLSDEKSKNPRDVFVSFDLDAVCGRDAPGVSAVGSVGLSSEEALNICVLAGSAPHVRLFDLSEFNPVVDEWRTGRMVVNMFYWFAMGVSRRLGHAYPQSKL